MVEFIKTIAEIILTFLMLILISPLIIIFMLLFVICLPFILIYEIITGDELI